MNLYSCTLKNKVVHIPNPYFKENSIIKLLTRLSFQYSNLNKSHASSFCFFACSPASLTCSRYADFVPYVGPELALGIQE